MQSCRETLTDNSQDDGLKEPVEAIKHIGKESADEPKPDEDKHGKETPAPKTYVPLSLTFATAHVPDIAMTNTSETEAASGNTNESK